MSALPAGLSSPSIVVTDLPAAALTGVTQLRIAVPSRCTVQAPQRAMPQPNFVPFCFSSSRTTQSSGVSAGLSDVTDLPFNWNSITWRTLESLRTQLSRV